MCVCVFAVLFYYFTQHLTHAASHHPPHGKERDISLFLVAASKKEEVYLSLFFETRLSQRVAMDDLASYFVEERSKVR